VTDAPTPQASRDLRPQPRPPNLPDPATPKKPLAETGPSEPADPTTPKTSPSESADPATPKNPPPETGQPAGPATAKTNPKPWNWAGQSDEEAGYLASDLSEFVAFYNTRYAWHKEHTIPPCWAEHGAVIEEITSLMWSRWAAFEGRQASPEAAQMWHSYHLPLFIKRVNTWIGAEAAADCRSGHHQPSRLAAAEPPDGRPATPQRRDRRGPEQ
jgi:hypothetical protein